MVGSGRGGTACSVHRCGCSRSETRCRSETRFGGQFQVQRAISAARPVNGMRSLVISRTGVRFSEAECFKRRRSPELGRQVRREILAGVSFTRRGVLGGLLRVSAETELSPGRGTSPGRTSQIASVNRSGCPAAGRSRRVSRLRGEPARPPYARPPDSHRERPARGVSLPVDTPGFSRRATVSAAIVRGDAFQGSHQNSPTAAVRTTVPTGRRLSPITASEHLGVPGREISRDRVVGYGICSVTEHLFGSEDSQRGVSRCQQVFPGILAIRGLTTLLAASGGRLM